MNYLEDNNGSDSITRRQFLKKSGIIGAVGLLGSAGWGFASRAANGKSVVKVATLEPTTINPGKLTDAPGQAVASVYGDYFFRLEGPDQERTQSLVKSYESSADKTEWTFEIKSGIHFHHGTELTARDVVYTMDRIMDPDTGSPAKITFDPVEDVQELGKYKVKFVLNRPSVDFPLKFYDYNTVIVAEDFDYSKNPNSPSGTGAYMVKDYVPGEKIIMEKNPDYFVDGAPGADELHFLVVPETPTAILMLKSGDADVKAGEIPVDRWLNLKDSDEVRPFGVQGAFQTPISMRTDKPPFNDPRVVEAMKYVVDRDQMIDTILEGRGELGHDHPVWQGYEWYKDLGTRERNIEKARQLLSEAGYSDLEFNVYHEADDEFTAGAVLNLQQMARPAGIRVKPQGVNSDVYYSKYWLQANATCTTWAHRENIVDLLNLQYKSDGPWNEGHYENSELDELIDKADSEANPKKRQEHFTGIQEILRNEGPAVIPFFRGLYYASSTRVEDVWGVRIGKVELRFVHPA